MLDWFRIGIGLSGGFLGALLHRLSPSPKGSRRVGRFALAVSLLMGAVIGLWLEYATSGGAYPLLGGWAAASCMENRSYGDKLISDLTKKRPRPSAEDPPPEEEAEKEEGG